MAPGQQGDRAFPKPVKEDHGRYANRQRESEAADKTMGEHIESQRAEGVREVRRHASDYERAEVQEARAEPPEWQHGTGMGKCEGHTTLRRLIRSIRKAVNGDVGLYRIGDETLLVGEMVQPRFFLRSGFLFPAVNDFWMQRHGTDPWDAFFIFGHDACGFIIITLHLKFFFARQVKESQHVAARKRRDECFLRVNVCRV